MRLVRVSLFPNQFKKSHKGSSFTAKVFSYRSTWHREYTQSELGLVMNK